jgi:hypothetical protein
MIFTFDLKPMDILVYAGIRSFCNRKLRTIVKAEKVAQLIGVNRNSVYSSVVRLEAVGLLHKAERRVALTNYRAANGYQFAVVPGAWIRIDYSVFKRNLTPAQFATYLYIKSCKNKSGRAFPSYQQAAEATGTSKGTVISAVKSLVAEQLITVRRFIRAVKCFGHNNYRILDAAIFIITCIFRRKKRALRSQRKTLRVSTWMKNSRFNINTVSSVAYRRRKCNMFAGNTAIFFWCWGWYKKQAAVLEPLKYVVRKKKISNNYSRTLKENYKSFFFP